MLHDQEAHRLARPVGSATTSQAVAAARVDAREDEAHGLTALGTGARARSLPSHHGAPEAAEAWALVGQPEQHDAPAQG